MDFRNLGILPQHFTVSQPKRRRQHGLLKRWCSTTTQHNTKQHGVSVQKTSTWK